MNIDLSSDKVCGLQHCKSLKHRRQQSVLFPPFRLSFYFLVTIWEKALLCPKPLTCLGMLHKETF